MQLDKKIIRSLYKIICYTRFTEWRKNMGTFDCDVSSIVRVEET